MKRRVYLICPVRNCPDGVLPLMKTYVNALEAYGDCDVFYPPRDVNQDDRTGEGIVDAEIRAIATCDEVHVIWDSESKGSHFDLGVAMALGKPLVFVHSVRGDGNEKSYEKVIKLKGSVL